MGDSDGADDGNRTRVFGLGSGRSAIELHLRLIRNILYYIRFISTCQALIPIFLPDRRFWSDRAFSFIIYFLIPAFRDTLRFGAVLPILP